MSQAKELEALLKNIQEGLKNYSLKELNEAILEALEKKHDKKAEIDFVLQMVCTDFDISIRTLKTSSARGKITDAKQLACCLLHFDLCLSIRHIAKRILNIWPNSVSTGIKRLKAASPNVKTDREFCEKYQSMQKQLLEEITKSKEKRNP